MRIKWKFPKSGPTRDIETIVLALPSKQRTLYLDEADRLNLSLDEFIINVMDKVAADKLYGAVVDE